MVVLAVLAAQVPPATPNYTMAFFAPVYATIVIVVGILIALAITMPRTNSKDRAAVIRALADLFRWFWRGGPPSGAL